MINICLLFGIFPVSIRDEIERNSKGSIQYAADALQKSFIAGITSHYSNVNIVNLPFVSSFPRFYKRIMVSGGSIDVANDGVDGNSLRYVNLPFIKFVSKKNKALKGLKEWGDKVREKKIIIVYSAHSPLVKAAVSYKEKIDKETKIILIIPDLPEFMSQKRNVIVELLKKIDKNTLDKLYGCIDGFILLSEYMTERLPLNGKPFRVIEGIFNPQDRQIDTHQTKKTVFYGGTLARRYGIMNLVHAFIKANVKDYSLVICGKGDSEDEICELASEHPCINYLGLLTREQVLREQAEASLLVNPRTPEGEFTRYSFPSKTMEYLASGVPTLLYNLPGIPKEYYDYCFTVSELGVDALADSIKRVLEMPQDELKKKGEAAQIFILSKKNPKEQCLKLCDLIQELYT